MVKLRVRSTVRVSARQNPRWATQNGSAVRESSQVGATLVVKTALIALAPRHGA